MLSTLKRQCNRQVQRFCVTQVCLYMLSVINKHPYSLFSTRQHVCHSALYAVAHPSVRRPSVTQPIRRSLTREHVCYSALYAVAHQSVRLSVSLSVTRVDVYMLLTYLCVS